MLFLRTGIKFFTFGFLFLFSILLPDLSISNLESFNEKGSGTHTFITTEAIKRFSKTRSYSPRSMCAEMIIYFSNQNDYSHESLAEYHCDNDGLVKCSVTLRHLVDKAVNSINHIDQAKYIGMSMHIIQDFYSHSNWVEKFQLSYVLAPTMLFNNVPPPAFLQSGLFPDAAFAILDPQAYVDCYYKDAEEIRDRIYLATHDCMNKDSNDTKRGITPVPYSTMSYHELAAEYAIRHSVKLLERIYARSETMILCSTPSLGYGCAGALETLKRISK
jgi:hypothetical protein